MTNNTAVNEAGAKKVTDFDCVGNHPDGPMKAVSHFHEDGPTVCGTHYARMRHAEMKAKRGQEKAAIEAALKEPAPTKNNTRSRASSKHTYSIGNIEVSENVGIWIETAAGLRNVTIDELAVEIFTAYYNQTCPEHLKEKLGGSESTQAH